MVHTMLLAGNYIPICGPQLQTIPLQKNQSIQCDVVFGSPSAECRGTGICKITGTNGLTILNKKQECKSTQAFMVERADQQGVTFVFFRSLLCTQLYRHHFWKGFLTITEHCPLPEDLRNGFQTPFTKILPGKYAVEEVSGYLRVDIDCAV